MSKQDNAQTEENIGDILDLCRLNLLEETVLTSPAVDRDTTLKAIDVAKRHRVMRIKPSPVAPGALEQHIADNTRNGVYPWTDTLAIAPRDDQEETRK